jgi:apolipoprotein D and lipocalin family protein
VDLDRCAGDWLELARLPAFFQRGCLRSRAEYAPSAGGMSVVNRCATAAGELRRAEGLATPVAGSGNTRLRVRFRGFGYARRAGFAVDRLLRADWTHPWPDPPA